MTLTAWLRVQKREVEARMGAREWGEARIKGSLGSNWRAEGRKTKGKKASDGKIKSSSALEYLMQRESQITNMLKGLEEEEEKEEWDGRIRNE